MWHSNYAISVRNRRTLNVYYEVPIGLVEGPPGQFPRARNYSIFKEAPVNKLDEQRPNKAERNYCQLQVTGGVSRMFCNWFDSRR